MLKVDRFHGTMMIAGTLGLALGVLMYRSLIRPKMVKAQQSSSLTVLAQARTADATTLTVYRLNKPWTLSAPCLVVTVPGDVEIYCP